MENLFSYGTLQKEKVQLETFGRKLDGNKDTLIGYEVDEYKRVSAKLRSGIIAWIVANARI